MSWNWRDVQNFAQSLKSLRRSMDYSSRAVTSMCPWRQRRGHRAKSNGPSSSEREHPYCVPGWLWLQTKELFRTIAPKAIWVIHVSSHSLFCRSVWATHNYIYVLSLHYLNHWFTGPSRVSYSFRVCCFSVGKPFSIRWSWFGVYGFVIWRRLCIPDIVLLDRIDWALDFTWVNSMSISWGSVCSLALKGSIWWLEPHVMWIRTPLMRKSNPYTVLITTRVVTLVPIKNTKETDSRKLSMLLAPRFVSLWILDVERWRTNTSKWKTQ